MSNLAVRVGASTRSHFPSCTDADASQIGDDVKEAMQEAHQKSMQLMSEKMAGLYAELGLPGAGAPPS